MVIGSLLLLALAMGPGVNADGYFAAVAGDFLLEWGFTTEILEAAMAVTAERNATDPNRIDCSVTLYRGTAPQIDLRFALLWDELEQT